MPDDGWVARLWTSSPSAIRWFLSSGFAAQPLSTPSVQCCCLEWGACQMLLPFRGPFFALEQVGSGTAHTTMDGRGRACPTPQDSSQTTVRLQKPLVWAV
uniref:Uncharacterized protein n=1 Tax=Eutreptiella gymnastica TaxID=73025 RepID=A0A7S1IEI8_9EUGL